MATFTAGTSFTDGVTGDVTAAKLNALVANATPLSNFITDRTAETSIATDDLVLISDTSDSGALNKMTVANFTNIVSTGTGTAADPAIRPTSDTNTGIFFPAADTIAFSEGGTESMRIDSSGRVGIGTTQMASSDADLHIFRASGATVRLDRTGAGTCTIQSAETGVGLRDLTLNANTLLLNTASTERLRIDSSGNVLIGTTSASVGATGRGLLEINGSTDSLIALKRGGTAGLYLYTSSAEGRLSQTENLPLTLYTNNTERLRIDSSGNVGIGTTSPTTNHRLTISDADARMDVTSTNATYASLRIISNNTAYASIDTGLASDSYTTTKNLVFQPNGGFVSIGTATGLSALHVHGNVTLSNTTTATSAGTGGLSKPETYAGYLTVSINGTSRKIPYYAT